MDTNPNSKFPLSSSFFLGILGILGILSCAMLLVLRYMSRVYFNCIDIDDRGIDGSVDIMNHFMENSF